MPETERPMAGKVCLITGATAGIGLVTARELARRGATVVLVGRSPQKCRDAVDAIRSESDNEAVGAILADLSSLDEVRLLADQFRDRHDRLDVLINNAGAMFTEKRITVDGFERTFALNHLAPFALTGLLLDLIRSSSPSRVITVASEAHRFAKTLDLDRLRGEGQYRGMAAYGNSKLMNILFTAELARRLEGTGVTANALHPGFVRTSFFDGPGAARWVMRRFADLAAIGPEAGARTSVYLATSPEVAGVTGQYFNKCRPATPTPLARDPEAARRLWDLSEQLTGVRPFAATDPRPAEATR